MVIALRLLLAILCLWCVQVCYCRNTHNQRDEESVFSSDHIVRNVGVPLSVQLPDNQVATIQSIHNQVAAAFKSTDLAYRNEAVGSAYWCCFYA